jgi:hypothetical protein
MSDLVKVATGESRNVEHEDEPPGSVSSAGVFQHVLEAVSPVE